MYQEELGVYDQTDYGEKQKQKESHMNTHLRILSATVDIMCQGGD